MTEEGAGVKGSDEADTGKAGVASRRRQILERLQEQEFVSVEELVEEFQVTGMSVRRDLNSLAQRGQITRIRGGATRARSAVPSRLYMEAERSHAQEKAKIARVTAELLESASSAVFYSGSTVAKVAAALDEKRRETLTVVTPALPIINEVSNWVDPHLVSIGGVYLPSYMAFVGPQAISSLKGISADVAVMGCDGLTAQEGMTTPHQLVAELGTVIVERAMRTIVVADSSKIGKRGFTHIAPASAIDTLITDGDADTSELDALRDLGIEIIVV